MKVRFKIFFPMILFILFVVSLAYPQIRESGEIQGTVTDLEDMPLPGVTVTVESPNLIGGPQFIVTGSKGFYKFRSLSIGIYKVTARLSGFNILVKEEIRLHVGMTLTVDFKMTQTTLEEEVIVLGDVPTIDIKSSQPNKVVITDNLLTALPGKPVFEGIMNMTPGTGFYDSYGGGYDYPSTYQYDGVYLNSPSTGSIRQFFTIDINTIKEVSIQALGLPAEYGHFTGAVMTAVSKSGSNKFSTLNEFSFIGEGWNSQNNQQVPLEDWRSPAYADYEYETTRYFDVGLQAGGKLIQDKLWFFISGEYDQSKEYPIGTPNVKKNYNPRFFAKLTLQLNPSNKLNFAVNRFQANKKNALASSTMPPDIDMDTTITGWLATLSWTSIFSSTTFLDSKFGFNWKKSSNMPLKGNDVPGGYDLILRKYVDNYTGYGESTYWTYHASSHLSHYVPEFLSGSHDFKMGTELIHMKEYTANGYPGGIFYYYWNGANYQKTERDITVRDKYSTALTGFIQDRWSVTKRLTLNLGLRYDHYWHRIPSPDRGVVYNNSSLSPRLGFAFDLLGDRKNVVKVHYAHYNEKLKSSSFSLFENRYDEAVVSKWIGGAWVEQYTSVYTPQDIEQDAHVTHPFIREITISFERELFRDASLSITFFNRSLGISFYQFNFAAEYADVTLTNPGPDNKTGTADDLGTFTGYYQSNPGEYFYLLANAKKGSPEWSQEEPKWYARGIQIVFTKKFSNRWQMIASYNYTRSKGNEQGTRVTMTKPNYYNVYGEQGAYYPQPHQFKIQANVILPVVETSVGLFARWESGPPLTPRFVVMLPYGYGFFNSEPPGQTKGRAVSNVDLKIEKIINIRGVRLTVMLDIFNLTNNYDRDTGMYLSYGPYFMTRTSIKVPRTFRAGFRIIF